MGLKALEAQTWHKEHNKALKRAKCYKQIITYIVAELFDVLSGSLEIERGRYTVYKELGIYMDHIDGWR